MQKRELMRCRTSNFVIHGRKCEIDQSNRLGNIQAWWTKLKNKSKSLNHAKFKWNNVSLLNMNEKNAKKRELMKWWWNWVCDGSKCLVIMLAVCTNFQNSKCLRNEWEFQWNSNYGVCESWKAYKIGILVIWLWKLKTDVIKVVEWKETQNCCKSAMKWRNMR